MVRSPIFKRRRHYHRIRFPVSIFIIYIPRLFNTETSSDFTTITHSYQHHKFYAISKWALTFEVLWIWFIHILIVHLLFNLSNLIFEICSKICDSCHHSHLNSLIWLPKLNFQSDNTIYYFYHKSTVIFIWDNPQKPWIFIDAFVWVE